MKVVWLGLDDTGGCVLHWQDLRHHLRDHHGVTLLDAAKSWLISEIEDLHHPDWIVVDECNANGYVNIRFDRARKCRLAVREHDWWNRRRRNVWYPQEPELVLACYSRPLNYIPGYRDSLRERPGWKYVPHVINTKRFHAYTEHRPYIVGFYGKHGTMYDHRTRAREQILALKRIGIPVWVGKHSGYWHNGPGTNDGVDYCYNDELADKLRQCQMVWVDSPDRFGACVLKYLEAAACGCLIFGEAPFDDATRAVVPCNPEDIPVVVQHYSEYSGAREMQAYRGWERVSKFHSIEAKAQEIMTLLEIG